jgi:hypothetical protein
VPSLCDLFADIPPSLDAVFQKMMAKKPDDRFQSMRETIAALEELRDSGVARRPLQIGPDDADVDLDAPTAHLHKPADSIPPPRPLSSRDTVHGRMKQDTDYSRDDLGEAEDNIQQQKDVQPQDDILVLRPRPEAAQRHAGLHDRKAARWVLLMGGGVVIVEDDGRRRRINDQDALPARPFVVETVGLAYNQLVSDDDLARFAEMTHLARIYLDGTNITDEGVRHLPRIASLAHVALGNTKVSDLGIAYLTACKSLRQLSLYATQVGDACLPHLRRLTLLEKLNLTRTRLSPAAVEALRRDLPACEILS